MDLNGMQLGAVFPHNEIGTNPADIKACLLYTSDAADE